jgi:hypothetical protein
VEPFLLSLLSLKRKFGDWDSREKLAPVHDSFVAGVNATETAATYRSGCLRSGKLPWNQTSVARRDPPIKPALLAESRLVRYGEKKGKMPYEEFRKLFELNSVPNPVVGRESHPAAQLSGHWRAGYASLPCC